jgi:predicted DNA-binding WGR domain protein
MTADLHTELTRCDPARNLFRFYALSIERNLFNEWSLIRYWGRIVRRGRMRIDWHPTLEAAQAAYAQKLREKHRRGYRDKLTPP